MHPILLRLPLPHWTLPLGVTLAIVALVAAGAAVLAWRAKALDIAAIAVAAALGSAVAAVTLRGQAYTLEALPLSSFGVVLCVGLAAGWVLTIGLGRRDGLPRDGIANVFVVSAIGGLVGARVLFVLANLDTFGGLSEVVSIRQGGLNVDGALWGATAGAWAYCRVRRFPFWTAADVSAPALALGLALGRVGSYLLGSAYGRPLGEGAPSWLVTLGTFPHWPEAWHDGAGAPAWVQHVTVGQLPLESVASLPVHPTQLYEALGGAILVVVTFLMRRRQTFRGQIWLSFVIGYGALRVLVDWLRGDPERGLFGPHVPEHRLLPLVVLILAAAYGFGPARSVTRDWVRRASQVLPVLVAAACYGSLRPGLFALPQPAQLSAGQWLAVAGAVVASLLWVVRLRQAEVNPRTAMEVGVLPSELPDCEDPPDAPTA